jgi:hypothetical protein
MIVFCHLYFMMQSFVSAWENAVCSGNQLLNCVYLYCWSLWKPRTSVVMSKYFCLDVWIRIIVFGLWLTCIGFTAVNFLKILLMLQNLKQSSMQQRGREESDNTHHIVIWNHSKNYTEEVLEFWYWKWALMDLSNEHSGFRKAWSFLTSSIVGFSRSCLLHGISYKI